GLLLRHQPVRSEFGAEDRLVAHCVADLRRAAHRAPTLWLARPLGGALDAERFRDIGGRLFRREIRPRIFVRATLGLGAPVGFRRMEHPSLGLLFTALGGLLILAA